MKRFLTVIDRMNEETGNWVRLLVYAFTGLVCFEVLLRYGFNKPTIQLPVIVTMLAAAMYVLSLGNIARQDGHVRIDVFTRLLSKRGKAVLEVVCGVLFFFPIIGAVDASAIASNRSVARPESERSCGLG